VWNIRSKGGSFRILEKFLSSRNATATRQTPGSRRNGCGRGGGQELDVAAHERLVYYVCPICTFEFQCSISTLLFPISGVAQIWNVNLFCVHDCIFLFQLFQGGTSQRLVFYFVLPRCKSSPLTSAKSAPPHRAKSDPSSDRTASWCAGSRERPSSALFPVSRY
jgi:hypothetical protein